MIKVCHFERQDRKALQRVIKTAQIITGADLKSISDLGEVSYMHGAQRFLKDNTQPSDNLLYPAAI